MSTSDDLHRIVELKDQADRLATEATRAEAAADASEQRLTELKKRLVDAGFDPHGDLAEQIADRRRLLDADVAAVEKDLAELKSAAAR